MFFRPKILFLVSLLFVALLNPKFNPYLLFKVLIFYHSSIIYIMFIIYTYHIYANLRSFLQMSEQILDICLNNFQSLFHVLCKQYQGVQLHHYITKMK